MSRNKKPELTAPAGDLEKLKTAAVYGADAVYIGGMRYGLRANATNFSEEEMKEGIDFCHKRNVSVYITANAYARNDDIDGMADYFRSLEAMGADALIVSDPGVFCVAAETVKNMDIHISTQANTTNYKSVMFWASMGAKRIILARELSLAEIADIRKRVPPEIKLEAFVHGAMCVSYSGRCLISSFLTGRGANEGDCAQPCRWEYALTERKRPGEYMPIYEDGQGTYLLNSKDLCMAAHIPELAAAGIDSLKIEGRMKSVHYVAGTVKAYRQALDDYYSDPAVYKSRIGAYMTELGKTSHRQFTTGFYLGEHPEGKGMQIYDSTSYIRESDFLGVVRGFDSVSMLALVEQRGKFVIGDKVEFVSPEGDGFTQTVYEMYNEEMEPIASAPHPQQRVYVKVDAQAKEFDLMRKESRV